MDILKSTSLLLLEGIFILIYVFLIFYISKSNLKKFVKGVLIIGISAVITRLFLYILSFSLSLEIVRELFYYTSNELPVLNFIPTFIYPFGTLLFSTGVAFIISKNYPNNEIQNIKLVGSKRSIGTSILLFVISIGLYFPFWLYDTIKILKMNFDSEVPYSPSRAVGFLFIPIFNIFWAIYLVFSLPNVISKIERKHYHANVGFCFHPILISFLLLFIPISSYLNYFAFIGEQEMIGKILGEQLFYFAALIYSWIIIQAKINAFYDFIPNKVNN